MDRQTIIRRYADDPQRCAAEMRKRIQDDHMLRGPFDEDLDYRCPGYGEWKPEADVCLECSVNLECICKTLGFRPKAVYVPRKQRKSALKDPCPFELQAHRDAFEAVEALVKGKRVAQTITMSNPDGAHALQALAVVDALLPDGMDAPAVECYWNTAAVKRLSAQRFSVNPKAWREAREAARRR